MASLDDRQTLTAKLVIFADGGRSETKKSLGFELTTKQYSQIALIANVVCDKAHQNWAFERFTEFGPLALLPLNSSTFGQADTCGVFSLVWTVDAEDTKNLQRLIDDDNYFLSQLSDYAGVRHGRFVQTSQRTYYPLQLSYANQVAAHRSIAIGNAAQALHPIAGQGFNLGLRDVKALTNLIVQTDMKTQSRSASGESIVELGDWAFTHQYQYSRNSDRDLIINSTDALVHCFSNHFGPLVLGVMPGLLLMNKLAPINITLRAALWGTRVKNVDIAIIGGGMVGLSLAAQLAESRFEIALVNQGDISRNLHAVPEARVSAINIASESLLKACGAWSTLQSQRFRPYTHMQVWDKDSFGQIDFSFEETNIAHLGHIIENQNIINALFNSTKQQSNLTMLANTGITRLELGQQAAIMHLNNGELLSAGLVIGADGANSLVRKVANLPHTFWSYDQSAIVATVKTDQQHNNIARQVFTPLGPLAFLPLADPHHCSIVWSQQTAQATRLMGLTEGDFNCELSAALDMRLGLCELVSQTSLHSADYALC